MRLDAVDGDAGSGLRRPSVAAPQVELVSVAGARDVAHASLMLGEQRAWIEHVTGLDLAAVQPDERGNLLY